MAKDLEMDSLYDTKRMYTNKFDFLKNNNCWVLSRK
jgi:hypothetical protein